MKKIRFVNPIKECKEIQGKGYTITVIATIVAAIILCIICAALQWSSMTIVYAILSIGQIIGFGCWFGIETLEEESMD